jgi:putative membrane protein
MMGSYMGMGWTSPVLDGLLLIALWALIVVAVVGSLRASRRNLPFGSDSAALRQLNERFARGELDAEQYARDRELLRSSR